MVTVKWLDNLDGRNFDQCKIKGGREFKFFKHVGALILQYMYIGTYVYVYRIGINYHLYFKGGKNIHAPGCKFTKSSLDYDHCRFSLGFSDIMIIICLISVSSLSIWFRRHELRFKRMQKH